jgi:DNA-binding HxlR family transcriptional regulator
VVTNPLEPVEIERNPYRAGCPTRKILDRIGDRWTVLIIGALGSESRRFSYLLHQVEGISQKMLTQTLRALERDGLLTRTVYAEVPLRVEYKLTKSGSSLLSPLAALEKWSIGHFGEISVSQTKYDKQ